jgi:hypothetical protein
MDKGHTDLIQALDDLAADARNYQFHDFKDSPFPTPKIELIGRLETIIRKVKDGEYDN